MINKPPSVEELQARLFNGQDPVVNRVAQVEHNTARSLASLEQKMKKELNKVKSKKLTPTEIRAGIDAICQKHDFNPIEELIVMAQETQDERVKKDVCMFLTEFIVPKLKSVEVKGQVDHVHTVVIRRYGRDGIAQDEEVKMIKRDSLSIDAEVIGEAPGSEEES